MALLSALLSLLGLAFAWDQTGTRFALEAFQLLEFPLLLTFTAFVELPDLTEPVHQLQRLQYTAIIPYLLFLPGSGCDHAVVIFPVCHRAYLFIEHLQDVHHRACSHRWNTVL